MLSSSHTEAWTLKRPSRGVTSLIFEYIAVRVTPSHALLPAANSCPAKRFVLAEAFRPLESWRVASFAPIGGLVNDTCRPELDFGACHGHTLVTLVLP